MPISFLLLGGVFGKAGVSANSVWREDFLKYLELGPKTWREIQALL